MIKSTKHSHTKGRVVVFGVFDGIHDGHRDFFRQARAYGEELVVIVGRDSTALQLKKKKPKYLQEERLSMVVNEPSVDRVVLGDRKLSTYRILQELNPSVICLGYDQQNLKQDLEQRLWKEKKRDIRFVMLKPYHQEIFHNSFLA